MNWSGEVSREWFCHRSAVVRRFAHAVRPAMQDFFTGQPTRLRGRQLPGPEVRAALQDEHERRLAALARLGAAAAECGLRADSDRDLVLLAEDEVSLLEVTGGEWAAFGDAIRAWRARLPLRRLEDFGFLPGAENPLEES